MKAIYKKELRSYFSNMTGYVAIAMILIMTGIFVKLVCFDSKYPTMEDALPTVAIILLLAIPILTMRAFAEERHQHTDLLLYSLPMNTTPIVLGKYFAIMTVLLIPLALMGLVPLILSLYGTINYAATLSALALFYLLAAAMTAICLFMSTLTSSQVIAAVLGSGALIFCYFSELITTVMPTSEIVSVIFVSALIVLLAFLVYSLTKNAMIAFVLGLVAETVALVLFFTVKSLYTGMLSRFFGLFALFDRYVETLGSQLFDLSTVGYYLSFAVIFLVLTVQSFDRRRWN